MSISGYFGISPTEFRADRKDRSHYLTTADYDPVLRSHCRLAKPDPAAQEANLDYWTRALEAYFETQR